jgi:outer membrane protein TolC
MRKRTSLPGLILGLLLAGAAFATVTLDLPAAPPDKKDSRLKDLLKERLATLRALVEATTKDYQAGKVSFERVQQAMQALLQAQLELCESDKERITVLEESVTLAKGYEKHAQQRYQTGNASHSDVLLATAARLEAEIGLERAKSKAAAPMK